MREGLSPEFREMAGELEELFGRGVGSPLDDDAFGELALRVFRYQVSTNPAYEAYCRRRVGEPGSVARWQDVPAVPTAAFKALPLVSGDPERVERVFRTSGTTRGRERRGEHHVLDLGLYEASLRPNFRAHLLPDVEDRRILALVPPPERVPDSSLSHMVGVAMAEWGAPGSGYWVEAEDGLDVDGLEAVVRACEEEGRPVLIAGTAFALVRWWDAVRERGTRFRLPPGSRVMETGGFKGRSRAVEREELYAWIDEALGVPPSHVVNEYGMTELLSQFYEPVLSGAAPPDPAGRWHAPPPWVRTRILDPATLEERPRGEAGVLCHFDLANLGSVAHVLTEDLGAARGGGFRLLGRAGGAEPRGCSLAMEDFMDGIGG